MRKEGQVGVGEGSGNVAMPKTHHRAALVAVKELRVRDPLRC